MAESSNTTTSTRDPNIFYESTPDGDIRIIDQNNNHKTDNNNSAGDGGNELFQHNLRKSWDDEYEDLEIDAKIGSGGDGGTKSSAPQQQQQKQKPHQNRHRHNLSVQFFDISISDDKVNDEGASEKKEQASAAIATTTLMDTTVPAPPPTITADTTPSPQHSRTKSSIEVEAAAAYYFESNDDSPEKERAKNDDIANFQKNVHSSWESGDEEENDAAEGKQVSAFSTKPTPSKPSRHHHNLSVQFTDSFVANHGGKEETEPQKEKQQQRPPPQPQAPNAGIVVPVPIVVRPSANRKHRRVYSGRSNPAMAHRRVNTRGDSAPTKGEVWAPTPPASIPPPHSSLPPPHNPAHPHPATGYPYPPPYYHQAAPPPPPQPYAPAPTPPPPYRAAPTPPPPYDSYYAVTQPVDPRYYAAPSPHHNQSPVSDAGVNYDERASPMIHQSPGIAGQCPPSVQSSPGGYYADQSPHPPRHSTNLFTRPPNHLSQPPLDQEDNQQREKDNQTEKKEAFSDRSKENDDDGGNAASSHHHHRKQSSLGDFLVNSGFEDLFEDGGYDSAPDEQQSKRHNKTLSSASFLRSLSSDNFLKDHLPLVEEERHSGDNSPYPSPQVNSAPNTPHGGAYHQPPYPGYFQGPPPSTSSWQQHPSNYPQHSPIQPVPSTQHRQLFGVGTVQTQFASPSQRNQQCLPASTPSSAPQDSTQKRQRRKCSVPDCPNRVVQGGLCIGHGAKRKTCSHPGCTKNVKAKGLCSTHGPARKRCAAEGCTKVAVQGGRCIAHGAKKKVCTFPQCTKQAILGGMCKKHHDETHGIVKARGQRKPKNESPTSSAISGSGKPGHERGLSLFTDSAIVDSIISNANAAEQDH